VFEQEKGADLVCAQHEHVIDGKVVSTYICTICTTGCVRIYCFRTSCLIHLLPVTLVDTMHIIPLKTSDVNHIQPRYKANNTT
jgi:hypothetical protein